MKPNLRIGFVLKMSDYTISSGNRYKDLDNVSFDKELTKVKLSSNIVRLIEGKGMTHKEAACRLGVNESQITDLKIGQLNDFTIDHLFALLKKLDCRVEERLMEEYREQGFCWRLDDESSLKMTAILLPLSIAALSLPYLEHGPPKLLGVVGGLMLITFWFILYQSYEDRLLIRWKRIHEIEWILGLDSHLMMHRERFNRSKERSKYSLKGEPLRWYLFIAYLVVTVFIIIFDIEIKATTLQGSSFENLAQYIGIIEWGLRAIMVIIVVYLGYRGWRSRIRTLLGSENKE